MARPPCACNHAFVRLNGREPKNPRRAESGDEDGAHAGDGLDALFRDAIHRIALCPSYDCGTVTLGARDPMLSFPTDVQVMGDVVLVVNSQMRHGLIAHLGDPTLPFTVAAIPLD